MSAPTKVLRGRLEIRNSTYNPDYPLRAQVLRHAACGSTGTPFAASPTNIVCPGCMATLTADPKAGLS